MQEFQVFYFLFWASFKNLIDKSGLSFSWTWKMTRWKIEYINDQGKCIRRTRIRNYLVLTEACWIFGWVLSMTFLNDLLCDFLMKDFHLRINSWGTISILRRLLMHKCSILSDYFISIIFTCKLWPFMNHGIGRENWWRYYVNWNFNIFVVDKNVLFGNIPSIIPRGWLCCSLTSAISRNPVKARGCPQISAHMRVK